MKKNLHRQLTVGEVGRAVGLSNSRVSHLCQTHFGMSPLRMLRSLRLQEASILLETSALTVKEIAARVGYNDSYHFARDFKKVMGVTPSEFRRRLWGSKTGEEDSKNVASPGRKSPGSSFVG
jgi:AraC-like DNA-binding protein